MYSGRTQETPNASGGVKQSTFCIARRKTMITMGSPDFVWINANEIISSWYLRGAACVSPPYRDHLQQLPDRLDLRHYMI
jgi:hypothetical protein